MHLEFQKNVLHNQSLLWLVGISLLFLWYHCSVHLNYLSISRRHKLSFSSHYISWDKDTLAFNVLAFTFKEDCNNLIYVEFFWHCTAPFLGSSSTTCEEFSKFYDHIIIDVFIIQIPLTFFANKARFFFLLSPYSSSSFLSIYSYYLLFSHRFPLIFSDGSDLHFPFSNQNVEDFFHLIFFWNHSS